MPGRTVVAPPSLGRTVSRRRSRPAAASRARSTCPGPLRLHVVGVGGPGMSAIAIALAEMGHAVSGSDLRDQPVLDRVRAAGVDVHVGHDRRRRRRLRRGDVVDGDPGDTTSSSRGPRARASRRCAGPGCWRRSAPRPAPIGVAGTHGKTTTTSMLMLILAEAGLAPELHRRRRRHRRRHRRPLDRRRVARRRGRRERRHPPRAAAARHDPDSTSSSTSSTTTARSRPSSPSFDRYLAQIAGPEGALRRRPGVRRRWPPATAPSRTASPTAPTSGPSTCAPSGGSFRFAVERATATRGSATVAPAAARRAQRASTPSARSPWRSTLGVPFDACRDGAGPLRRRRPPLRHPRRRRRRHVRRRLRPPAGRDRRRHRRRPRQRRRVAAGRRRVPAQPLQPHRRDVAGLRRRLRRRRRRRDHRHLPVGHDADPGRHRASCIVNAVARRPPRRARGVAAAPRRRGVVPRRRGRPRRRVHLDGLRRHRHAARGGARPARRRGGRA